ncbi:hypothetical protein QJS66_01380 [Kocuria rhizophila]|nr:hypothetical protein QJS66_01380 [Kocuria rhizophila]
MPLHTTVSGRDAVLGGSPPSPGRAPRVVPQHGGSRPGRASDSCLKLAPAAQPAADGGPHEPVGVLDLCRPLENLLATFLNHARGGVR